MMPGWIILWRNNIDVLIILDQDNASRIGLLPYTSDEWVRNWRWTVFSYCQFFFSCTHVSLRLLSAVLAMIETTRLWLCRRSTSHGCLACGNGDGCAGALSWGSTMNDLARPEKGRRMSDGTCVGRVLVLAGYMWARVGRRLRSA